MFESKSNRTMMMSSSRFGLEQEYLYLQQQKRQQISFEKAVVAASPMILRSPDAFVTPAGRAMILRDNNRRMSYRSEAGQPQPDLLLTALLQMRRPQPSPRMNLLVLPPPPEQPQPHHPPAFFSFPNQLQALTVTNSDWLPQTRKRTWEAAALSRDNVLQLSARKRSKVESSNHAVASPASRQNSKWLASLEQLKQYKSKYGDCVVPRGYADNPRLASWVAEQRKQYKLLINGKPSSMTRERVELLDQLEFAWDAQEAAWQKHIKDLKQFRNKFGHCHVPVNHCDFPKLGLWIKEQRRHYSLLKKGSKSHMTLARAAELDAIGMCWDTHETMWLERLRELVDFKEKHGTCNVPTSYRPNHRLGTWVHHQRRQYKKFKEGKPCHITAERIQILDRMGFVWYPRGDKSLQEDDSSCSGVTPAFVSDSSSNVSCGSSRSRSSNSSVCCEEEPAEEND